MKVLVFSAVVCVAGSLLVQKSSADERSAHRTHEASVQLASHPRPSYGHSHSTHSYRGHGHGHWHGHGHGHGHYYGPHYGYAYRGPVIVPAPVYVYPPVPYRPYYPGYYHSYPYSGMHIQSGRIGFSIGF